MTSVVEAASSRARAFAARLHDESVRRYHEHHPFHRAMHDGELTREQLRAWVANRYYYQTRIPIKDALVLAKSEDREFRRNWIRRIHDHDDEGAGLELWERLGAAVGVPRGALRAHEEVLPGVRAACDAYVELVRGAPLVVAVAASLTERLAPELMQRRIEAWERHYPWVASTGLDYFRARVTRAREDGEAALAFVLAHAPSVDLEDACAAALVRKTEILWTLLDELTLAHGIGPGAQRPRLSPRARMRADHVRGGTVLLAPDRGLRLDASSERIVRLCDGTRTVDEIVALLVSESPSAERRIVQRDVQTLVERLVERRILDVGPISSSARGRPP